MKKGNQFLFEISWEVCNKVGGIYTVIRSKLNEVVNNFGENYLLLGPLFEDNPEFYEDHSGDLAIINDQLKQSNITSKVGRWKVDASPKVALIKFEDFSDKDKLLYELWNDYGVDSMSGGWDYIEPVLFSTNAAKAIEVIYSQYEDFNIFAHFHEWMTGAGLLYLRKNVPNIATIFTSHATVLGRSMAGNGVDIYGTFQNIDSKKESAKYNVTAKHTLESASARETDCFTTVSEITGMEATHILHMKPDVILPNGFNVHEIPDYNSNRTYYRKNRKKMTTFASQFLMKDLSEEDTVIISTSGRYEYHNKGIDLLIETLENCTRNNMN